MKLGQLILKNIETILYMVKEIAGRLEELENRVSRMDTKIAALVEVWDVEFEKELSEEVSGTSKKTASKVDRILGLLGRRGSKTVVADTVAEVVKKLDPHGWHPEYVCTHPSGYSNRKDGPIYALVLHKTVDRLLIVRPSGDDLWRVSSTKWHGQIRFVSPGVLPKDLRYKFRNLVSIIRRKLEEA